MKRNLQCSEEVCMNLRISKDTEDIWGLLKSLKDLKSKKGTY